jgi:hypothetical protein
MSYSALFLERNKVDNTSQYLQKYVGGLSFTENAFQLLSIWIAKKSSFIFQTKYF